MSNKRSQLQKVKDFVAVNGIITTRYAHRLLEINQPFQIIKMYRDTYGIRSVWVTNGESRFKVFYTKPNKLKKYMHELGLRID